MGDNTREMHVFPLHQAVGVIGHIAVEYLLTHPDIFDEFYLWLCNMPEPMGPAFRKDDQEAIRFDMERVNTILCGLMRS